MESSESNGAIKRLCLLFGGGDKLSIGDSGTCEGEGSKAIESEELLMLGESVGLRLRSEAYSDKVSLERLLGLEFRPEGESRSRVS